LPLREESAQNPYTMPSIGLLEQCFQAVPSKFGKSSAVFDPCANRFATGQSVRPAPESVPG
jgi:hypothetical protein